MTDFSWSAYDEFCRFCLYPLLLMSHGEDRIARLLMWEDNGVLKPDVLKLIGNSSLSISSRIIIFHHLESTFARKVPAHIANGSDSA